MTKIDTTIILSDAYGFEHLETTLYGYNNQAYRLFEVIIVTENNTEAITKIVNSIAEHVFFEIHIQPKTTVIGYSNTEYLIFSNTNTIPRKDFIEQHVAKREEGYFITGKTKLFSDAPRIESTAVYREDCFDFNWLRENGLDVTERKNTMICNTSAWKTNAQQLDIEALFSTKNKLELHLKSCSLKAKTLRNKYICVHLQSK
ncbi:hypothetical protein [Pontimicrobium sp. MEBiC01747]